jgi:hypothetical protein
MMLILFSVFLALLIGAALAWRFAFHAGFAAGRSTIPLQIIREVAERRISLGDEDAEVVARDLGADLLLPPDEIRRLREIRPESPQKRENPEVPGKLRPAS